MVQLGRNLNRGRRREGLLFRDFFHPSSESKLHLSENITLNTNRFFGRHAMCSGKILSCVSVEPPIPVFICLLQGNTEPTDVLYQSSVPLLHQTTVGFKIFFFYFPNVAVDEELLSPELPCDWNIAVLLKTFNDLYVFKTETREESN